MGVSVVVESIEDFAPPENLHGDASKLYGCLLYSYLLSVSGRGSRQVSNGFFMVVFACLCIVAPN